MKKFLAYELAPYPLPLFDEGGMRKTRKSVFYNLNSIPQIPPSNNVIYVVDGGFLLHRVIWHINNSVDDILKQYVAYVLKHYSKYCYIVFDGYPDDVSNNIKFAGRLRR
jgi:hypothetical protein